MNTLERMNINIEDEEKNSIKRNQKKAHAAWFNMFAIFTSFIVNGKRMAKWHTGRTIWMNKTGKNEHNAKTENIWFECQGISYFCDIKIWKYLPLLKQWNTTVLLYGDGIIEI